MADRFFPGASENAEPASVLIDIGEDEDGDEEEDEEEEDDEYEPSGGESDDGGDSAEGDKRRRTEAEETCSPEESSQEREWNLGEIDGLFCSICMEAWTNDGDHHICCLPCGHIYGLSCINRWLKQRKNQGKCPQCNRKCTLKDVRKLFASRLVAVDEALQKRIRSLEAKCASLQKKRDDWRRKEANWRKIEAGFQTRFQELTERTTHLEGLVGEMTYELSRSVNPGRDFQGKSANGPNCRKESSCRLMLQEELQLDGAHLFDIDTSDKILLIARSPSGMGVKDMLTKMSLIHPHEREDILLPPSTNLIKDLHFSPSNDGLALFSSLGKKLSLFSMESNKVVLACDLPAASWTCSWDLNNLHYVYAGLQNGSVFMFDKRQTAQPVKFLRGLTSHPVHTVHSLLNSLNLPSDGRPSVLSASAAGLSEWNFEGDEGPTLVPGSNTQGVCISLTYCPSSDDIVASYRPRVEMPNKTAISQPSQTPSSPLTGRGVMGCHFQYRRPHGRCLTLSSASANLDQIRLPKCAIIDRDNQQLLASRDERSCNLILQGLPGFSFSQSLNSDRRPLRDIKYTNALGRGLLGCISGDTLQIFGT